MLSVAGFGLSYQLATSAPATTTIFLPRIKPWILAFFTITLTNSILCTSTGARQHTKAVLSDDIVCSV
jgi:hypothetical protein